MNLKRIISLLIALFLFIIGTTILLYVNYISPVTKDSNIKIIEIKQGSSSRDIGNILYNIWTLSFSNIWFTSKKIPKTVNKII